MQTVKNRGVFARLAFGLAALLLWQAQAAYAQGIGEVEYSRGAAVAQMPGKLPRTLGKGLPLNEGDRLTTAEGAMAIVKLQDGTRLTLRPNSEMVMQNYRYDGTLRPDNSMVMQLLRGGFRAITGLISKARPTPQKFRPSPRLSAFAAPTLTCAYAGPNARPSPAR